MESVLPTTTILGEAAHAICRQLPCARFYGTISIVGMTLLVLLTVYLATFAVGRALLRLIGGGAVAAEFTALQRMILALLLGIIALGHVALLGNALWILPRPVALSLLIGLAIGGAWSLCRLAPEDRPGVPISSSRTELLTFALFLSGMVFFTAHSWFPELNVDGWRYQYTTIKQWLVHGGFTPVPYEIHANFYLGFGAFQFWTIVLSPDDFLAPRLHQIFLLLCLMLWLGEEFRRLHPWAGWWLVALFWITSWEVCEAASTDYIDMIQGFYHIAALTILARCVAAQNERMLALAGVLLGGAICVKITGLVWTAAAISAWVLAGIVGPQLGTLRNRLHCSFKEAALLAALAVATAAPWWIKSSLVTHNPVYPFAVDLFPTHPEYAQAGRQFHNFYEEFYANDATLFDRVQGKLAELRLYLSNVAYIDQNRIALAFVVCALLAALRREHRPGVLFLHAAAVLLLPAVLFTPAKRFVLGAAVLMLYLVGVEVYQLSRRVPPFRALGAVLIVGSIALGAVLIARVPEQMRRLYYTAFDHPPRFYLTTAEMEREVYRKEKSWATFAWLNANLKPSDRVLITKQMPMSAALRVKAQVSMCEYGKSMIRLMAEDEDHTPPENIARLRAMGLTYVFTMEDWDTPRLRALEREHLEFIREDVTGMRLYRIR